MNAGDDFADASLDAGLFPEFCDVFAGLPNDDPSIFGAHERTKSERVVAVRGGRAGLRGRAYRRYKLDQSRGREKHKSAPASRVAGASEGMVRARRRAAGSGGRREGKGRRMWR